MSVISEALLDNLLEGGMPVVIVPESALRKKKKTLQESFSESFRERVNMKQVAPTGVIPSPS